jgi:hypothetical protein
MHMQRLAVVVGALLIAALAAACLAAGYALGPRAVAGARSVCHPKRPSPLDVAEQSSWPGGAHG